MPIKKEHKILIGKKRLHDVYKTKNGTVIALNTEKHSDIQKKYQFLISGQARNFIEFQRLIFLHKIENLCSLPSLGYSLKKSLHKTFI